MDASLNVVLYELIRSKLWHGIFELIKNKLKKKEFNFFFFIRLKVLKKNQ